MKRHICSLLLRYELAHLSVLAHAFISPQNLSSEHVWSSTTSSPQARRLRAALMRCVAGLGRTTRTIGVEDSIYPDAVGNDAKGCHIWFGRVPRAI